MDTEYEPPYIHGEQGERSAQIIQVDNGKAVAAVAICAAICGLSLAVALWAGYQAQVMTTEYRVQINHTMHLEAEQEALRTRVEIMEKKDAIK